MPTILIADYDFDTVDRVRPLLELEGYEVLTTVTGQAGILVAQLRRPDVVLVDIDLPDIDGYDVCRALRSDPATSDAAILIHSARGDVADKVAGFKAGASDYIVKPAVPAELLARIRAALRTEEQPLAPIITLWGAKGGVGTTTLATNLAVALRSRTGKRVTLVDAAVPGGTLGVLLNLAPRHTIADLLPRLDDLDSELLAAVLAQHSSGIRVLLSPPWLMNGDSVQPAQLERILASLQQASDYVIVDTSSSLDGGALRALQLSRQVIVVLTPEMTSVRNTKLFLDLVGGWEQAPENLLLVVNRCPLKGGVKLKEIETVLHRRMDAQIPNDEALVTYSVSRGIPLVSSHRRSPVAMGVLQLAEGLAREAEHKARTADRGVVVTDEGSLQLTRAAIRKAAQRPRISDRNILMAATGGGIAFAGNLAMYVIRFAFGIVLARLLGPDLLGIYSLSLTVTEIGSALSLLGLGAGMARYVSIARARKDENRLWGVIQTGIGIPAVAALLLAIGVFTLAQPLSIRVFSRPDLVSVLRLASLGIPLLALLSVLGAITQGFKRMEFKVYTEDLTLNLVKLVLSVVLVGLGLSAVGAMAAHVIALAVTVAMLFVFVHRLFPLKRPLGTASHNAREMLAFSLPVYLSQLLNRFSGSIETLMLGAFGVMSGVGIYTTALRLSDVGRMFHQSLQRIAVPMISDLHDRGEMDQLAHLYQTTTRWDMTFNLPIFLTLAIFAKPLLAIFGAEFVAGSLGLVILGFYTFFNASTGVSGSFITMTGRSKLSFVNSIIYLVCNITLDLILIPRWGPVGAALGVMLSGVLINVLRVAQVHALLDMWPYDRSFLKPLAASVVAAVAAFLTRGWLRSTSAIVQLAVGAPVLWAIYAVVIVALRLSQEDRLVLGRLWARLTARRFQSQRQESGINYVSVASSVKH